MTGNELLNVLSGLADEELDREVEMEGCDCVGDLDDVEVDDDKRKLLLLRKNEPRTGFVTDTSSDITSFTLP